MPGSQVSGKIRKRDVADWMLHPGLSLPSGAELRGEARRALADGAVAGSEQQASGGP